VANDEKPVGKEIEIPESSREIAIRSEGVVWETLGELMDFAKLMAIAQRGVPAYLRRNVGDCLSIAIQAKEWGMSPFSVARQSYVVNDQIAYQAQLLHAIVLSRVKFKERPSFSYDGEFLDMRVTVSAWIEGESAPLVYESPLVKDIKVKNSPLWHSDPKQQLSYYGIRAWARRFCPEVLLGVYSDDELPGDDETGKVLVGAENAKDVTPPESLTARLSERAIKGAGFDVARAQQTAEEALKPIDVSRIQKAHEAVLEPLVDQVYEAVEKMEKEKSDAKPNRGRAGRVLPGDGPKDGEGQGSEAETGSLPGT
jgi:RecT family